ncbi:hypothetical protein HanPSC8_Chr04g0172951 [Helianthus annuus]|nr:hypothetical protein HanPSC8_Chr04g0172951 [Helianthus annuus]
MSEVGGERRFDGGFGWLETATPQNSGSRGFIALDTLVDLELKMLMGAMSSLIWIQMVSKTSC